MKFLDLAGVQQFKDYNDSKYVVTEDVVDLTAGSLDFYTKGEIDEMLEDFDPELTETDPVFTASAASGITSTDISNWNSKQDAISDLATIRSNAADGAAKVSNVQADWNATSGLAQILHKPTIPAEVTESTVSGWGFTKNAGTITGITMNGASKGTSGVIDLGTVITSHQDISGKADKSAAIGSLSLSLDSTNYKITLSGTKVDGTTFTVSDVIDLPLESVVVNGSYNNTTKKVVLTLQNGNTVDFSVADLVSGLQSEITSTNKLSADLISDGTTNKTVTATEKSTWNGKQDAISDLATIRSNAEAGAAKVSNVQSDWNATSGLAQILNKPTIPAAVTESTVSGWGFTKNTGTVTQVKVGNKAYNPSSGIVSLPAYPARAVELYKFIVNDIDDLSDFTSVSSSTYSSIKTAINASKIVVLMFSTQDPYSSYFILDNDTSLDDCIYFHRVNGNGRTVQVIGIWPNGNVDYSSFENYVKPSGGIPKTDLASAVQTSLGKADTALQSFTETDPVYSASAAAGITSSDITNWNSKTSNVGTITGITMNGSSKGTSGVVNLGTVVTSETDPVFTASAAAGITSSDITNWNNKVSNVQSDWNATTGAAVILNKPTIPAAVTESTVSGWGFTKNTGTYSKPSGGIPSTDLDSDVQGSLENADKAIIKNTINFIDSTTLSGAGATQPHIELQGLYLRVNGYSGIVSEGVSDWSHIGRTTTSLTTSGVEIVSLQQDLDAKQNAITSTNKLDYSLLTNTPTIPAAPGTLKTNNTTAQTASASEALSGTINLHKVSKTGNYYDLATKPRIFTGTCTIAAGTQAKTVTCASYDALTKGDIVFVTFSYTNTHATPTLNVNGKGAKSIKAIVNGALVNLPNPGALYANETIEFQYDGTYWVAMNTDTTPANELPSYSASNNGQILSVVNGALAWVTPAQIYSGSATPNNNTGNNGDIYLQTS